MAGSITNFSAALAATNTRSIILPPGGGQMSQVDILAQLDDQSLMRARNDPDFSPVLVKREIERRQAA